MPPDGRKSRRSASSNFDPTPVGGGSGPAPTAGGLETEQGAGRRGACAGWTASEAAGGAAGAMLLRWDVCDGVWKGIGVWKGDVMWMRVDGEALACCLSVDSHLRWGGAGFKPAPLDPRRRIGAGSTASASGGRGGDGGGDGDGDGDGGSRQGAPSRARARAAHAALTC